MTEPFFRRADTIDAAVQVGPSGFTSIRQYLDHPQLQLYFFSAINDPRWLNVLVDAGFYTLDDLSFDEQRFIWARIYYLKRVASQKHNLTQLIVRGFSDPHLITYLSDIATVAVELPPHSAAGLVPTFVKAIQQVERLSEADNIGKLAVHLGDGGEVESSLQLVEALLAILPDTATDHDSLYTLPTPQTRLGSWEYKEFLDATVPALLAVAPLAAFKAVCDLLENAVRHSLNHPEVLNDHSTTWRAEVAPNPEEYDAAPRDSLVITVRDAATYLASSGKMGVPTIVEHLEARRWSIFRRIALHLLMTLEGHGELATQRLTDPHNFDDAGVRPEYNALLSTKFNKLGPAERDTILGWIKKGPDTESHRRAFQELYSSQSPEKIENYVQGYIRSWQRRYLALLKPQLTADEALRFHDLLEDLTEEDASTSPVVSTSWVGPRSPKMAAELNKMPVGSLVRFLKDEYEPSGDFMGDSPEGLSRQIQRAVSVNPEHYANSAMVFSDLALNPTYHAGLFRGFREAVKENKRFSWAPIVELAHWLVQQDDTNAHRYPGQVDQDRNGFRESRRILPDLLSEGFVNDANPLPFELHNEVWRVIVKLSRDPDPDPVNELRFYSDVATVAINAVRSEALTAVIRYGLWFKKEEEALEPKLGSSSHLSRVWSLLDSHLDIEEDPSLAVRSVYGRWLPWLEYLDRSWVENNSARLFPKMPEQKPWYEACWHTYLHFNTPYNNMFTLLRREYRHAIDHLEDEKAPDGVTPEKRLAEHLLLYYVRELINLNEPDNIVQLFYQNATLPLRQYTLEFLGRVLRSDSTTKQVFIERLTRLVDYRLEKTVDYREFEQLGWWIDAKVVPDEWKLTTLQRVLPQLEKIDPLRRVLTTLAQLVEQHPEGVLKCFEALAQMPLISQRTHILQEPTRTVFEKLVENPNAHIKERSVELAHEFGSKGLWNLRDLTRDTAL